MPDEDAPGGHKLVLDNNSGVGTAGEVPRAGWQQAPAGCTVLVQRH